MISLFEGIENQDYLEMHVDSDGCKSILNTLGILQTSGFNLYVKGDISDEIKAINLYLD